MRNRQAIDRPPLHSLKQKMSRYNNILEHNTDYSHYSQETQPTQHRNTFVPTPPAQDYRGDNIRDLEEDFFNKNSYQNIHGRRQPEEQRRPREDEQQARRQRRQEQKQEEEVVVRRGRRQREEEQPPRMPRRHKEEEPRRYTTQNRQQSAKKETLDSQPDEEIEMMMCPRGCGRKFREEIIHKHAKICKKVFQDKRKVFDASKQRALEDEVDMPRRGRPARRPAPRQAVSKKKNNWKQESEKFRAMMRDAKGTSTQQDRNVLAQAQQQEKEDMLQCPHCQRRFNEKAGTRHIPHCAEKQKRNQFRKR